MNRALASTVLLAAVVVAGCGDDDPEGSISTRGQWCSLVREVDEQFFAADTDGDPFEERQAAYADIADSIERLESGLDQVDDEARDAVAEALADAKAIALVYVDAEDDAAAGEAAEAVIAESEEPVDAAAWINDNCDVDING